jgi:DNA-binding SARP family transcriptional activator
MDYRILGSLEVADLQGLIPISGKKQRKLLAALLVHANEAVSSDLLIEVLWGDEAPANDLNALQVAISQLRKTLGRGETSSPSRIETRSPGYALHLDPAEFDAEVFRRKAEEGKALLATGEASLASAKLAEALGVWRGRALAEFAYDDFAQPQIRRLEELRIAAVEDRIEADLSLGRHVDVVVELEALVREHPARERLREGLMLALYRSGRQTEALGVYQDARKTLADELGIDPSPSLQRLETAILQQDPSLDLDAHESRSDAPSPAQSPILVASVVMGGLEVLHSLAGVLAAGEPTREVILVRLLNPLQAGQLSLASASEELEAMRLQLVRDGVPALAVVFTSSDPGEDIVRVAKEHAIGLLLVDGGRRLLEERSMDPSLRRILAEIPSDLAILVRHEDTRKIPDQAPIVVPFGGADQDWAALEFAAGIAKTLAVPLRLLGVGLQGDNPRDASRLLAKASLVLQRMFGIAADPILAQPGTAAILQQAEKARFLVVGLSDRWQGEGVGSVRAQLAVGASVPTILFRRAQGHLAPVPGPVTKFPWSKT